MELTRIEVQSVDVEVVEDGWISSRSETFLDRIACLSRANDIFSGLMSQPPAGVEETPAGNQLQIPISRFTPLPTYMADVDIWSFPDF